MSGSKKRKVNTECWVFNKDSTTKYFFHWSPFKDCRSYLQRNLSGWDEFLKEYMVEIAGILDPESNNKLKKKCLSCRTVAWCVVLIDEDLACKLNLRRSQIVTHMNELNVKLQGKDQFVYEMYTNVRAFKTTLVLFRKNKCQTSHLLISPQWLCWKRPLDMWKNTGNHKTTCIDNSAVGSLILDKFTSHFSSCHVPSHKTLKGRHRNFIWN